MYKPLLLLVVEAHYNGERGNGARRFPIVFT